MQTQSSSSAKSQAKSQNTTQSTAKKSSASASKSAPARSASTAAAANTASSQKLAQSTSKQNLAKTPAQNPQSPKPALEPASTASPESNTPESANSTNPKADSSSLDSATPNSTQKSATQAITPDSPESTQAESNPLDSAAPSDPAQDGALDTDSSDLIYTPLPLQIKPQDILSAQALKDSQQNITLQKTTNESGFTIVEVYDSAKVLRARLSFKNGALEGISQAYKNGQVAREIPYKNGLVDGVVITYLAPDRRMESSYKAGKKHGGTIIYHNDTPIITKEYRDGVLHGMVEASLQDSGQASQASESSKSRTQYRAGKKQGESIGYTDDRVVFRQYYDKGMLQGQTQTYGENEIIKISREYKNDLLHGEEIVYSYPQQTPLHKSHYELGMLISPYEIFDNTGGSYFSMKPSGQTTSAQAESKDLIVSKQQASAQNSAQELWLYDNGQSAMEITRESSSTHVRTFYKSGTLASDYTITRAQASGSFYAPDSQLESKILYTITPDSVSKTTWIYAPKEVLRTKSQELSSASITQTYRNGVVDSEIATMEDREITIQKRFFPNGKLEFEHKYIEDKMVQGTLWGENGAIIYAFPHASEDMIFDEAFPNTAAKKRAQVFPRP